MFYLDYILATLYYNFVFKNHSIFVGLNLNIAAYLSQKKNTLLVFFLPILK